LLSSFSIFPSNLSIASNTIFCPVMSESVADVIMFSKFVNYRFSYWRRFANEIDLAFTCGGYFDIYSSANISNKAAKTAFCSTGVIVPSCLTNRVLDTDRMWSKAMCIRRFVIYAATLKYWFPDFPLNLLLFAVIAVVGFLPTLWGLYLSSVGSK
jgi:hypothetical protein